MDPNGSSLVSSPAYTPISASKLATRIPGIRSSKYVHSREVIADVNDGHDRASADQDHPAVPSVSVRRISSLGSTRSRFGRPRACTGEPADRFCCGACQISIDPQLLGESVNLVADQAAPRQQEVFRRSPPPARLACHQVGDLFRSWWP